MGVRRVPSSHSPLSSAALAPPHRAANGFVFLMWYSSAPSAMRRCTHERTRSICCDGPHARYVVSAPGGCCSRPPLAGGAWAAHAPMTRPHSSAERQCCGGVSAPVRGCSRPHGEGCSGPPGVPAGTLRTSAARPRARGSAHPARTTPVRRSECRMHARVRTRGASLHARRVRWCARARVCVPPGIRVREYSKILRR